MADIDIKALSTPGSKPKQAGNLVIVVKDGQCGDGCGGAPNSKKSKFRQGHDASLRSKLNAAHRAGVGVEYSDGKTVTTVTAAKALSEHGWEAPAAKTRSRSAAKSKAKAKAKSPAKRLQKRARPASKRALHAVGVE